MPKKPTSQQLLAENAELRDRLEKAEATLSEILSGEADALVIPGANDKQLFTLQGADESYRLLIENMSEGALTLSTDGLVLYANHRFAEMIGTPLEKVIGSEIYIYFTPESRQALQTLLQKNTLDKHREEMVLTASDKTQVPAYLSLSRFALDGVDSISMVVTDLTAQKRSEAIHAAEKLSNAILEQVADAIVICDPSGRIIRANQQAQALSGNNPLGQQFEQAFPLRKVDGTAISRIDTIDTGSSLSLEARLAYNEREYDLLVSVGHLKDAENELLGSVVTLNDFTERRQAEENLKLFRSLLDDSSDAIEVLDPVTTRLLDVNETQCRELGYSREELLSMKIADIDPDFDPELQRGIWEQIEKTGTARFESIHQRKDGSTFPVEVSSKLIELDKPYALNIVRNITERKQAELALRESEAEFHTLAEAMPQIVWISRPDGWNIYINQQWMDYTGLSLEESLGTGWNKSFHPDDRQRAWDAWLFALKNLGIYSIEARIRRADGKYRWWLVRGVPQQDADGNIVKWFGTCTDIHDLKMADLKIIRTNNELRESERRFSDLLGNVELISIMLDRDSQITYCNDYLLHLTGWKREEVMGKSWWDVFVPPDLSYLEDTLFTGLLNEQPKALHHENDIVTRSGERRLIRWNNSVLHSTTGEVTGVASIGEDITEREKAAASIKYLNRVHSMMSRINTLIVHVKDREDLFAEACNIALETGGFRMAMIVLVDPDTKLPALITSAGKDESLLTAIKGVTSSSETMQKTLIWHAIHEKKIITSNDTQKDPRLLFGKQYAEAGVRSMAILPLISSGEASGVIALYASECNFFNDEEVQLLMQLVDDIAFAENHLKAQMELRQLTDELEEKVAARTADLELARQESDRANQAKSIFLAAMSHEIRTPMNGVIGMIDVLQRTSLGSHQLEMVELISESAYSLLGIIDDILNFSKIEAGKLEIEQMPISLVSVVEKACDLLDHLAASKHVELTLFIDPAIPEEVIGDALRLRQVLVNLINNAIKFSSELQQQGKVSLRASLVENGLDQVTVEFKVIDNGIGMDETTKENIFNAFTQADTSTTRRFGGTGLGLVISHDLVVLMGGEISVQSAPDKGSTFTVRLPFTPLPGNPLEDNKPVNLDGLSCIVLGDQGFADDLAIYLTYADAIVKRSKSVAAATKLIATAPDGLLLFIIDARDGTAPIEELRAACLSSDNQLDPRFMVVERGRRRRGRVKAPDHVTIDGDVMRRQSFLEAVGMATGQAQEIKEIPSRHVAVDVTHAPSREHARQQGRLILVAEDNETNQKVIRSQLTLLGFTADIASDGVEALERWRSGDYGLVLADLHMPNMDGYRLTDAIRTDEAGMRHTPIVALTANALADEAEHCRAVGMDDYLSKPARLDDLKDMVNKWLPDIVDEGAPTPNYQNTSPRSSVPVDIDVLTSQVGDDPAVIDELLQDFLTTATKIATVLMAACEVGDAATAGAAAHKLKSSAFSIGAQALGEVCVKIEQASKVGKVDALSELMPQFEEKMTAVNEFLETL